MPLHSAQSLMKCDIHPQSMTPIKTDNSYAADIANDTVKQRRSKAMLTCASTGLKTVSKKADSQSTGLVARITMPIISTSTTHISSPSPPHAFPLRIVPSLTSCRPDNKAGLRCVDIICDVTKISFNTKSHGLMVIVESSRSNLETPEQQDSLHKKDITYLASRLALINIVAACFLSDRYFD
jgi:hypothetical protein